MSKRSFLQSMPLALCSGEEAVPDWVQLTPQGPRLPSRDGREWQLPDPDAVVRAYMARGDSELSRPDHPFWPRPALVA